MAKGGLSFKAVGASLDTLAKRCHDLPKAAPSTFAFANSGVIQQAGRIVRERYIVPGDHAEKTRSGYTRYTAPPGGTHGPISYRSFQSNGRAKRDLVIASEKNKLFIKGKFVSRTGQMEGFANEIASSSPSQAIPSIISDVSGGQRGKTANVAAYIDHDGRGIIELSGGYRSAEVGQRGTISNGVRGWFRGLRTASSQWSKLLNKKYPGLLSLSGGVK